MKKKYLIIISFFLFILDLNSKSLASEVKIESDKVEFINNLKDAQKKIAIVLLDFQGRKQTSRMT